MAQRRKLGNNPFGAGVDGLIRGTVMDAQEVQDIQQVQEVRDVQAAQQVQEVQDAQQVQEVQDAQQVQGVHDTHEPQGTQGRKGRKLPRINMAFAPDVLEYLHGVSAVEGMSVTAYVNGLVRADMRRRTADYERIRALRKK